MEGSAAVIEQLRSDAHAADELHRRSRQLLVQAARSGAAAGLTQREIAAALGRSQPEVSRLLHFQGTSKLGRKLVHNRRAVLDIAAAYGATGLRVFGSVARGTDTPDSDIDFLADIDSGTSLFMLARLERALSELLGSEVDVVPAHSLPGHIADRISTEAIAL